MTVFWIIDEKHVSAFSFIYILRRINSISLSYACIELICRFDLVLFFLTGGNNKFLKCRGALLLVSLSGMRA